MKHSSASLSALLSISRKLKPNRNRFAFLFGLAVVVLSVFSSFVTYFILTGLTSIAPSTKVVVVSLVINFLLVFALLCVVGWQIFQLWNARRKQTAGAKLHISIVAVFSLIATLPAILLAVFANISLDRGLDYVFSNTVKTIVHRSVDVVNGFIYEHAKLTADRVKFMSDDLDNNAELLKTDPKKFNNLLKAQSVLRNLQMAFLIQEDGKIFAIGSNRHKDLYLPPLKSDLQEANTDQDKALFIGPRSKPVLTFIKKLKNVPQVYLYVLQPLDPNILEYLRRAHKNLEDFRNLQNRRSIVQVTYFLTYTMIALTLLLAAVWMGLWFANRLVRPIRRLIAAAQSISEGKFDVQLRVKARDGDLAHLSETFNNMTSELKNQRNELVNTNQILDDRRRFMEAVLSGVTAGVIGTDGEGAVTIANPSAFELLNLDREKIIGSRIDHMIPELEPLLLQARSDSAKNRIEGQVDIMISGSERHFAVRLTREQSAHNEYGYVITFDDITELVAAQRNTAWADIARRIAHEIKNPLTPIQLSAERIRRKYGHMIKEDRAIFDQCTDTIIRQVGDIGRMVDEFSSFARMPQPVMQTCDVRDVIRDAFFLFQTSHPEIKFKLDIPKTPVISQCDQRLMSQAVTNLVKNASEAIASTRDSCGQMEVESGSNSQEKIEYKGKIIVRVEEKDSHYTIEVIDNGCGLPETNRNRLVEPYMTTREKGTGLGLAIVQKIVEQHGGSLQLRDAPPETGFPTGACVSLRLPFSVAEKKSDPNDQIVKNLNINSKTADSNAIHSFDGNLAHKNEE